MEDRLSWILRAKPSSPDYVDWTVRFTGGMSRNHWKIRDGKPSFLVRSISYRCIAPGAESRLLARVKFGGVSSGVIGSQ